MLRHQPQAGRLFHPADRLGAPGVKADTIVRCWNQRYGVADMLREKGEDGLADEMAYLGRFD